MGAFCFILAARRRSVKRNLLRRVCNSRQRTVEHALISHGARCESSDDRLRFCTIEERVRQRRSSGYIRFDRSENTEELRGTVSNETDRNHERRDHERAPVKPGEYEHTLRLITIFEK